MRYKIENRYASGWNDAGWTEEENGANRQLRFETKASAQIALNEFFTEVEAAVLSGNLDAEEIPANYRISTVDIC
jgi:hypothetical protein